MIARLNATEPLESDVVKSNPCELAAVIAEPTDAVTAGFNPSKPP